MKTKVKFFSSEEPRRLEERINLFLEAVEGILNHAVYKITPNMDGDDNHDVMIIYTPKEGGEDEEGQEDQNGDERVWRGETPFGFKKRPCC